VGVRADQEVTKRLNASLGNEIPVFKNSFKKIYDILVEIRGAYDMVWITTIRLLGMFLALPADAIIFPFLNSPICHYFPIS
jgi:hypothetical protein